MYQRPDDHDHRRKGFHVASRSRIEATREVFEKNGNFVRVAAHWPTDVAPPGAHQVVAVAYDRNGNELTRVAPRLVSVNVQPGY